MKRLPVFFLATGLVFASCAVPPGPTSGERTGAQNAGEERRAGPADASRAQFVQEGAAGVLKGKAAGRKGPRVFAASHRTLPLGVYVRVRNTSNGRETVVPILTRGPMTKRRVLDLSEAAAKAIGIPVRGTAVVRVEALGRREGLRNGANSFVHPESYENGVYTVQLTSFRSQHEAQRLVEMMKNLFGYSSMAPADEGGATVYRIFAGKYYALAEAEAAEKNFTSHGYPDCFVIALD